MAPAKQQPKQVIDYRPLRLAEIKPGELPRIEVMVTIKNTVNVIEALVNALIISPERKILYLESACTSDANAHALMGCIADDAGSREWRYYKPGLTTYDVINQPSFGACNDWSRELHGFSRKLHHVAIVDKGGELILAKDNDWLWRKLRSLMSCPTLPSWGEAVMPQIMEQKLVVRCEAFGIDPQYTPYVMGENAQSKFDNIIGAHVRAIGGIPERS